MTTLLPPNMTKPAVISTNGAGQKPTMPNRQQTKRPHQSTNVVVVVVMVAVCCGYCSCSRCCCVAVVAVVLVLVLV